MKTKRARLLALACCACLALCGCSVDKKSAYNKGIELFGNGEYAESIQKFKQADDYENAQTYLHYASGLVAYEKGDFATAQTEFEPVQSFMYGRDRYQYSCARVCQDAGDFAAAAPLYQALAQSAYEDAAVRAAYCLGRAAENEKRYEDALYDYAQAGDFEDAKTRLEDLQGQIYDYATELKSIGEFYKALSLFTRLENYLDSAVQAKECKDFYRSQQYDAAEALLKSGDVQGAYDAFLGLSGYSDAEIRAQQLAVQLGIDTGN